MQNFRTEPTLRSYYDTEYEFKTEDNNDTDIVDDDDYTTLMRDDDRLIPSWRGPENTANAVDWSPNRSRFRGQRRKKIDQQEKKKIEVPSVWSLPPAS